jgi:DNA/RNA endonuclease YhcR with UshA esterase domain
MKMLCRSWLFLLFLVWVSAPVEAQTSTVIPDTEAAQHVGQKATVEGTVAVVFTSKNGNTFVNFGGRYPHQTFTGWIPKDSELAGGSTLAGLEGKKIKITGTIELYRGKPEIKVMTKDQITLEDPK